MVHATVDAALQPRRSLTMQERPVAPSGVPSAASEYLSTKEAAALLGVHAVSMARWRVQGDGPPFIRLSRRAVRYARSSIDSWMQERTRTSTAA